MSYNDAIHLQRTDEISEIGKLMAFSENESHLVATLTVGKNTAKVDLSEISMESCITRVTYIVRPYQKGELQIHTYNGEQLISSYKGIRVIIESIRQRVGDTGASFIKLKFISIVGANHGIVQFLHTIKFSKKETTEPEIRPLNNSLRMTFVSCYVCNEQNIPFRSLHGSTMTTKPNIFGVPTYLEAYSGKDFCDFNLIRITICPVCFFSSKDIIDFRKKTSENEGKLLAFDIAAFSNSWLKTKDSRENMIDAKLNELNKLNGLFEESRSAEQAILSYELAVQTSDEIFKTDEKKNPLTRNYDPARKSLFYLFVKAELLMEINRPDDAQQTLRDIMKRLEFLFPLLMRESSIRSAYLLGMLNLYFEDYQKAGQYLNFLRQYNNEDSVLSGSEEYKALMTSLKKLDDAFQNREDYSKTRLKGFEKPY